MNENKDLENMEEKQEEKKKKRWIIWIILMIIVLLLGIKLGSCSCQGKDPDINIGTTIPDDVPDVDPNAGEYVEPEKQEPSKGVAIPGWGSLTIPANKKENIVVDFFNPEANKDLYYLTFEIRLPNDSELGYELLYKSGLVEPGLHIQKIDLYKAMEAGEYDTIVHVQPYRMEDKSATNNADLKMKLIVK